MAYKSRRDWLNVCIRELSNKAIVACSCLLAQGANKIFQLGRLDGVNVCAVGVAPSAAGLAKEDGTAFYHLLHLAQLTGTGIVFEVAHALAYLAP